MKYQINLGVVILLLINARNSFCSSDVEATIPFFSFYLAENVNYVIFSVFVLVICGIKVWYNWAHGFSKIIPESNLLLFCGVVLGLCFKWFYKGAASNPALSFFSINSDRFFNLLLPPIILEASFAMYHRTFASNIVGVLVFAVIATMLNFVFIGLGLTYISHYRGLSLSVSQVNISTFWVFSALIVAVDPVAVLAIFQEIHVDNNLYYLVFGESLLNDGVSVVLYETMIILSRFDKITINELVRTVISFLLVCLGGGVIGCIISVFTCLMTRFTYKTPLTEPVLVMLFGYLSYLLAGMIKWSGIISMIVYGVFQATYGFQNITQKSLILIKRLSKILSNVSEAVIFIHLGVSVTDTHISLTSFTFWSVFLCLYGRYIFTLLLSGMINYFDFNIRKIAWNEQFIIAYGGLRGGIAYCLALLIDSTVPVSKHDIQQTTIFIIFFTIFFMGMTMKPLVTLLQIEIAKPDELSLFVQISESAIDHLLAGMEEIIGMKGRNAIHEFFANIDEIYIRPFLQRDPLGREEKIMKVFEKMNLTIHMATTAPVGTQMAEYYLNKLKPQLRNWTIENYSKPDGLTSLHGSANLKSFNVEEAIPVANKQIVFNEFENIDTILAPRQSSEIHMDHARFAQKMSSMLNRKRRSLAVTSPKYGTMRIGSKASRHNDSEGEMLTMDIRRKKNL
uniref:Sodium/hydrogen exchanger n=1 Tax=Schmidtea mediterranea TaxID=79327 RepID=A0A0H3YJ14_SCHMD|nr:slc9a-6 [Schmidtea mediterranea]